MEVVSGLANVGAVTIRSGTGNTIYDICFVEGLDGIFEFRVGVVQFIRGGEAKSKVRKGFIEDFLYFIGEIGYIGEGTILKR